MPVQLVITVDWLNDAAAILTEKQYRVLELREKHGMSWRVIGAMTNTDQATVRGHHQAAVRKLSAHYERTGT
jgi:DNA-directed RNA polymerase specialized sigma24 family protein